MEKLLQSELIKTVIILGVVMAGSSALLVKLVMLITKIKGSFKPYQKAFINYLLIAVLLFSVIACLAYWSHLKNQQYFFLLYQAYFLLLGIIHIYGMQKYLKWSGNNKALSSELIFTLIIALLGSFGFLIVHRFFNHDSLSKYQFFSLQDFQFVMASSTICFIVPWFYNQTSQSALAIPNRVFKKWYYPISEEIEEPDEDKLKNLLVISFEFQKQINDSHATNFRAKAPVDMELGELFYYFINDYNERHPNDKIEFINDSEEPYGWVFYKKPFFYPMPAQYLNANKTIFNNGIKENNVVICSRSIN